MHAIKVGKLYNPKVRRWPECAQFSCRGGRWELVLFFPDPSQREIDAVRAGRAEFAMLVRRPVLFFIYRFAAGAIPWSDAPTTIHLVPEHERGLPEQPKTEYQRALLTVILVDATNGITRAVRATSLGPSFSEALFAATVAQAAEPWEPDAYNHAQQAAYAEFPTADAMAMAAVVRCVGGAP